MKKLTNKHIEELVTLLWPEKDRDSIGMTPSGIIDCMLRRRELSLELGIPDEEIERRVSERLRVYQDACLKHGSRTIVKSTNTC